MKQRFPSRDIWEDTPDSLQLETTVTGPQSEERDVLSPPAERPTTGAVAYHQEKAAAGLPLSSEEGRATTGIAAIMKPQVPARPAKSKLSESPEKSQPVVPERPSQKSRQVDGPSPPLPLKSKPVVPARPSKPITRESSENVPLTTVASNSSAKSIGSEQGAAAAKPKPPVPSRPVGSKIAALQGGFMSDLNKRLQLGPQALKKEEAAPEEPEVEKEKAPLVDARKGRARGPARRAPAKSPTPVSEATTGNSNTCGICMPSTLWQIDPEEDLLHVGAPRSEVTPTLDTKAAQSDTPTRAANASGESLHHPSEVDPSAKISASPPSAKEDANAEPLEDVRKEAISTGVHGDELEPIKPSDQLQIKSQSSLAPGPPSEEDLRSSTATLKPSTEDVVE